jgi:predicted class III extradiol MEMO1 family dioxygenase
MLGNWRITELPKELGVSFGMVQSILTEDFGMKCISLKVVPNLLTVKQKETHLAIARDLLQCADKDTNFMKTIIIGDESSVCWYNPETRAQSSHWKTLGSLRPKKICQVWNKVKVRLIVFFDHEGVVHHEYAPDGQTLNKEYYTEVLRWLHDAVQHK